MYNLEAKLHGELLTELREVDGNNAAGVAALEKEDKK